jgi:hypothetical protein
MQRPAPDLGPVLSPSPRAPLRLLCSRRSTSATALRARTVGAKGVAGAALAPSHLSPPRGSMSARLAGRARAPLRLLYRAAGEDGRTARQATVSRRNSAAAAISPPLTSSDYYHVHVCVLMISSFRWAAPSAAQQESGGFQ